MARQVEAPPARTLPEEKIPKEWFNGQWWEITPGEDVPMDDPEQARRMLYQAGRSRGKIPRTRIRDGKIYIQRK